ncbi:Ribokinase-like protein [Artomyces pyxidatus]|uniref:Ribokinase-like protein n=1 Tax=Artomyces pyxidatus TaxID=48021 RepID=A0ACB8ST44_9AGAM|nr:Ribokinase-like protein [Artomyces pyxidatus]
MLPGRVLSIQSHVTFGYVGGKAATLPLQLLGWDVDVVNTVNFSNHSGYHRFGGVKAKAHELTEIFSAMEANGFLRPSRLLTGFIPGAESLLVVSDVAAKLLEEYPQLIWLLDPVIGDAGKVYVAADVIPVYRSMLPKATIITPNWFEVEVLTDTKIEDPTSLRKALKILHTTYMVPNVVVSSIPVKPWLVEFMPSDIRLRADEGEDALLCLASSRTEGADSTAPSRVHAACVPLVPGYFSGVGDLFSALVLGHFDPAPGAPTSPGSPVSRAVSFALTKTHAILLKTAEYASSLPEDERYPTDDDRDAEDPGRRIRRMRGRELRLVQGQDILRGTGIGELRTMTEWVDFWA